MGKSRERYEPHFRTKIRGIPAAVRVTYYRPGVEGRQRVFPGAGPGDSDPPEPAEIELMILDRQGYPAHWLEERMTQEDWQEVTNEALDEAEARHALAMG